MIRESEMSVDVFTLALDHLASRMLNNYAVEPPPNVEEAIEDLGQWVRYSGLAIALGLNAIAEAIKDATEARDES